MSLNYIHFSGMMYFYTYTHPASGMLTRIQICREYWSLHHQIPNTLSATDEYNKLPSALETSPPVILLDVIPVFEPGNIRRRLATYFSLEHHGFPSFGFDVIQTFRNLSRRWEIYHTEAPLVMISLQITEAKMENHAIHQFCNVCIR